MGICKNKLQPPSTIGFNVLWPQTSAQCKRYINFNDCALAIQNTRRHGLSALCWQPKMNAGIMKYLMFIWKNFPKYKLLHENLWSPRILLLTCSLDVIIWSMSVRSLASSWTLWASQASTSASYWPVVCANTCLYTASEIWRRELFKNTISLDVVWVSAACLQCFEQCNVSTHQHPIPLLLLHLPLQTRTNHAPKLWVEGLHHQIC